MVAHCTTGPIPTYDAKYAFSYSSGRDWNGRRDSLTGEGFTEIDTAHCFNSMLDVELEAIAGGKKRIAYMLTEFLMFAPCVKHCTAALLAA